jgi:hypothetical protein
MLLLAAALFVGNNACAPCHAEIFRSYTATPMAQSSGIVTGGLQPGLFRHATSGAKYQIGASGKVELSIGSQRSERRLDYFIGSGSAGRSFLYSQDGFLFQAPVTWYARQSRWDVSPGYENDTLSRWNRAIEPECLSCHSSQVRFAKDYQNRYTDPPFAQAGVGCERCHGPGSEHVAGRGALVNPATLEPVKRDAVCAQCHMSGEARIARVGKKFLDYRPGEELSSYVSYFVYGDDRAVKSTNYVEKLATSRCKIASGDRLWCGACHDPHRVPAAQERVAWYRSKCLSCHAPDRCERGVDCAGCHMPKSPVQGVAHGMLTDHGISKRPSGISQRASNGWRLRGYSAVDSGNRELGLAYAEVFLRTGDQRQEEEAFRLLMSVPNDKEVELRLAGLFQRRGNDVKAFELYRSVLRRDPGSIVALVNIGDYYGSQGALGDAIALWREALVRNPCQTEAAANLKKALKVVGDREGVDQIRKSQVSCVVGGE